MWCLIPWKHSHGSETAVTFREMLLKALETISTAPKGHWRLARKSLKSIRDFVSDTYKVVQTFSEMPKYYKSENPLGAFLEVFL
jgi:hypothetical protein